MTNLHNMLLLNGDLIHGRIECLTVNTFLNGCIVSGQ